jgi:hypothetical protein
MDLIDVIVASLGILILVPLIFIIGIMVFSYAAIYLNSLRLWRLLRLKNRVLSLADAREKIKQKQGMIIVEAPTRGWNVVRVWWSPTTDFVPRPSSWSKDLICPVEDKINYEKFTEPSSGVALLVDGFVIMQGAKRFSKRHFGIVDPGFIFSGGVLFQMHQEKKRSEN